MSIRTQIIQKLVHLNEALFFYPKLKEFYKKNFNHTEIKILDVGANRGQSIDFFLGIYKDAKIDAFEPNKKLYQGLQLKYADQCNITVHNLGVSNISGVLQFNENILDETSTFESFNPESVYLRKKARVLGVSTKNIIAKSYEVPVIQLSGFIDPKDSVFYDILKIDVEGHELKVLQGLFDGSVGVCPVHLIQLENHKDDMYLNHNTQEEIRWLLQEHGFVKIAEIKHGFGDFTEIIFKNKYIDEAKYRNPRV